MDAAFWQERWQRGEIGFHKASINPLLQQWWPRLSLSGTESVLVPLCGKSLDLLWLRQAGHPVIGVELARSALEAFDAEHQLALEWTQEGDFAVARGAGFELLCGDYFALQAEQLAAVSRSVLCQSRKTFVWMCTRLDGECDSCVCTLCFDPAPVRSCSRPKKVQWSQ